MRMKNTQADNHFFRALLAATCAIGVWAATAGVSGVYAQGFAAIISPPRFELFAKPGEKTRQVVEITNASAQAARDAPPAQSG